MDSRRHARPIEKLFGRSETPLEYSSKSTRSIGLQVFAGDAAGDDSFQKPQILPIDSRENLEAKFGSGCCRIDLPSAYGPVGLDRRLADKATSLASEMFSWIRNKGEARRVK